LLAVGPQVAAYKDPNSSSTVLFTLFQNGPIKK
jgi:hypothetical protein